MSQVTDTDSLGYEIPWPFIGSHIWGKGNVSWVIEKIEQWLADWKRMYLSKGSRITLIKNNFYLPSYFMSLFLLPSSVANHLDMLQRKFLWGGLGEEVKFHIVRPKYVLRSLRMG